MGQEGILLALVEAMNLIHKEQGTHTAKLVVSGLIDSRTDFLDTRGHRREALDFSMTIAGHQFG